MDYITSSSSHNIFIMIIMFIINTNVQSITTVFFIPVLSTLGT